MRSYNQFYEPRQSHQTWRWAVWTVLAVGSYAYVNHLYLANLFQDGQSLFKTLGQGALVITGFAAMMLGPLALRGYLAIGSLAILCVVSISTNFVVHELMASHFTRDTAIWLFAERHQVNNALSVWWRVIVKLIVLASLLVWAMRPLAVIVRTWIERRVGTRLARSVRGVAVLVFLLTPAALVLGHLRGGMAESNLYAFAMNAVLMGDPKVPVLTLRSLHPPRTRNILVLMDESTRYDTFAKQVSRALPSSAIDYQHAYSISGCSGASNALMRWGLTRGEGVVHDPRLNASLWAYAKNAGLHTLMIDGQMTTTKDSHNFFLGSEFNLIDERHAMDIGVETDQTIAKALAVLTRQPGQRFIYVVLRGNHVPYAKNNLPPAMHLLGESLGEEYERSVAYTTGRFFAALVKEGIDPDTSIFYTSDHGQDLSGEVTHCRHNASEDDFEVPMVIIPAPSDEWAKSLLDAQACWRGGANHQNLRSTVLEAMGYARDVIERDGFPSLTHCPTDRRMPRFLSEMPFVSRLGEKLTFELLPFRQH